MLGSVLVVSHDLNSENKQNDRPARHLPFKQSIRATDFFRDVSTFIVLFAFIIIVCFDNRVTLWESTLVVGIYFVYIAIAIFVARRTYKAMRATEKIPLLDKHLQSLLEWSTDIIQLDSIFAGLNWPLEARWYGKLQHIVEYPFSVLRWLSIPSADMVWGPRRRTATIICPPFALLIMLLAWGGRASYTLHVGLLPVWALLVIVGMHPCGLVHK